MDRLLDIIELVPNVEKSNINFICDFRRMFESNKLERYYVDGDDYLVQLMDEVYDMLVPQDEVYKMHQLKNIDLTEYNSFPLSDKTVKVIIEYVIIDHTIRAIMDNRPIDTAELMDMVIGRDLLSSTELVLLEQYIRNSIDEFNRYIKDMILNLYILWSPEYEVKLMGWLGGSMVICFLLLETEIIKEIEYEQNVRNS